ncbi:MAG: glycosyltransferase [Bacilli bacterium]|nr:glycosyltransferase [Bacilli bacterium]
MDISIIIPTHNNGETIEKAIRSVLDQDFKGEYEICLALDNCDDSTLEVVSTLAKANPNIHFVEVDVRGDLRSRLAAFAISSGEYIMFLDGDDYLREDALSLAYGKMKDSDADIGNFGLYYVTKKGIRPSFFRVDGHYSQKKAMKVFLRDITYRGFMATKIMKRSLIEAIDFSYSGKMMIYMDALFIFLSICHARKVISIKEPLYYYNKANENSVTSVGYKRIYDNLSVRANMRRACEMKREAWLFRMFRFNRFRVKLLLLVDFRMSSFESKQEKRKVKALVKEEMKLIYGKSTLREEGHSYSGSIREISFTI